ncbi:MAG: hypothetical protein ABW208_07730 [Pyrinomonadaceae bacterium]
MPPIRPELLDELLKDYQKPEDLLGQDGLYISTSLSLKYYSSILE